MNQTQHKRQPSGLEAITPEMIATGQVFIDVYAMKVEPASSYPGDTYSRLCNPGKTADFFDIHVRPEDMDDNDGFPYQEIEDLSAGACDEALEGLRARFPGILVVHVP